MLLVRREVLVQITVSGKKVMVLINDFEVIPSLEIIFIKITILLM